jgi:hypothetical protein
LINMNREPRPGPVLLVMCAGMFLVLLAAARSVTASATGGSCCGAW